MAAFDLSLGPLTATCLLTLLTWRLLRGRLKPLARLLVANAVSFAVATAAVAAVRPEGAARDVLGAAAACVLPQLLWLAVALPPWRRLRGRASGADGRTSPDTPPPAEPPPAGNVIVAFWRGEYSLGVSFWVFGALLNAVLYVVAVKIIPPIMGAGPSDSRVLFFDLVALFGTTTAIYVWQTVGTWRSANRAARTNRRNGRGNFWPHLVRALLVIGIVKSVADVPRDIVPPLKDTYKIAFGGDPDLPDYAIRVMRGGAEAEISGGFKYGLYDALRRTFEANPQLRVVHLTSIGGRIGEALRVGEEIRSRGLVTYVASGCYSACTIAFAGGRERWIAKGATLGFHAGAIYGVSQDGPDAVDDGTRAFLLASAFERSFVSRALATPNSGMWSPAEDELLKAGVVTGVAEGSEFALSGFDGSLLDDTVNEALGDDVLDALDERFPEDLRTFTEGMRKIFEDGASSETFYAKLKERADALVASYAPRADDATLADMARLRRDRYAQLAATDPAACVRAVLADRSGVAPPAVASPEIDARAQALAIQAIRTAEPRTATDEAAVVERFADLRRRLTAEAGFITDSLAIDGAVEPAKHRAYCDAHASFYRRLSDMAPAEAAALMRLTLATRGGL